MAIIDWIMIIPILTTCVILLYGEYLQIIEGRYLRKQMDKTQYKILLEELMDSSKQNEDVIEASINMLTTIRDMQHVDKSFRSKAAKLSYDLGYLYRIACTMGDDESSLKLVTKIHKLANELEDIFMDFKNKNARRLK